MGQSEQTIGDALQTHQRQLTHPAKSLRLYVSGPMTGIEDANRPAFREVTEKLRRLGHVVINPAELDLVVPEEGTATADVLWRLFIVRDVAVIASAELDGIVLLDGWRGSHGARMEVMIGVMCGLKMYNQRGQRVAIQMIDVDDVEQPLKDCPVILDLEEGVTANAVREY